MPPVRNIASTKPMKTERTHEENQERAYIAASRRSDRSIEARLESAKRASEVHKKRTGRALRVTQEDVENEEMYEEEDGDLQMNFRNWAAQWYANSATSPDFNRKFQAYLASQSALNTAPTNFMNPQFGNQVFSPQYPINPFLAQLVQQRVPQSPQQQQQQQQQSPQSQFQSPQSPSRPAQMMNFAQSYRQSPYTIPSKLPPRSSSMTVANEKSGNETESTQNSIAADRRHSLPVHSQQAQSPGSLAPKQEKPAEPLSLPGSSSGVQNVKSSSASYPNTPQPLVQSPLQSQSGTGPLTRPRGHSHSYSTPMLHGFDPSAQSFENPSKSIDFENLQNNSAQLQNFFAGGEFWRTSPFYTYNPNLSKPAMQSPNTGMDQTLSPSSLSYGAGSGSGVFDGLTNPSSDPYGAPLPSSGLSSAGFNYGWQFDDSFPTPGSTADSTHQSFPADEWSNFLNADALDDNST